jgi:hypothetical protein
MTLRVSCAPRRGFTQEGAHVKPRLLAHRGASPMAEADVEFPFVHASAEATPFDDASVDIVYVPR